MLLTLAFRHLWVRKLRSLFLLLGFALGVGVMVVLLSVGEAMVDQSRDVSLVGGGEVTVLPQGIDVEAMRTGGLGGMFFAIDRARFLTRQVLGGPRHAALGPHRGARHRGQAAVPLQGLRRDCRPAAVRAGGEIPSRAAALGAGLDVAAGRLARLARRLGLRRAHRPAALRRARPVSPPARRRTAPGASGTTSTLATGPDEWWYITYLVGGEVSRAGSGGRLGRPAARHPPPARRPVRPLHRRRTRPPRSRFDTARADLADRPEHRPPARRRLPPAARAARRRRTAAPRPRAAPAAPTATSRRSSFGTTTFVSGYVVPGLAATASGRICVAGRCAAVAGAPAYHDHNWGVWRDVTWEWGAARGATLSLLYGGVYGPERGREGVRRAPSPRPSSSPWWTRSACGRSFGSLAWRTRARSRPSERRGPRRPGASHWWRRAGRDSVTLSVDVEHALATEMSAASSAASSSRCDGRFG